MRISEIKHSLNNLLLEAAPGKLTHLEHLEDLVYNQGYNGAIQALTYLNDIRRMLADGVGEETSISVKWDGAPAIIAGIDPEDGRFFVGTKSVFGVKEPKLIKSLNDINKFYGKEKIELKEKLSSAFKYLRLLDIRGVLQGDLMFTDTSKQDAVIGGEKVITFTPNTITYAVPADSDLGKRIEIAKLGIIFHTTYQGPSLAEMKAFPGVNLQSLNRTSRVWYDDATYKDLTGRATLTPIENQKIIEAIERLRGTISKISSKKFNVVIRNSEFSRFIKQYINSLVWKRQEVGDPLQFLKGYIDFYKQKIQSEVEKLKSGPSGQAAKQRFAKIKQQEEFIEDNMNVMMAILAIYKQIIQIKLILLEKLNSIESLIGTFRKDKAGYEVINPEGFVAVGSDGSSVKLVDRLDFSASNKLGQQAWKKR